MNKNARTPFGERLKNLRQQRGLTQTELGEKVGLSKRMIVHYERHVRKPPVDKLAALAQALNVKVDTLLRNGQAEETTEVDPRFARKLEKAKQLPGNDQKLLSVMIDELLQKNDLISKRGPRKKRRDTQ